MIELWRWHLPDLNGRLKPSTWRMTAADAQACHSGSTRVEGSLELRESVDEAGHSFASGLVQRESDGAMMPPVNDGNT